MQVYHVRYFAFSSSLANSFNPKYDVMMFNEEYHAWTRLCSCMTLAEGKQSAMDELS